MELYNKEFKTFLDDIRQQLAFYGFTEQPSDNDLHAIWVIYARDPNLLSIAYSASCDLLAGFTLDEILNTEGL